MIMVTPQVIPHTRHLAQQNDELRRLAATYEEAIRDALDILENADLEDGRARTVAARGLRAVVA